MHKSFCSFIPFIVYQCGVLPCSNYNEWITGLPVLILLAIINAQNFSMYGIHKVFNAKYLGVVTWRDGHSPSLVGLSYRSTYSQRKWGTSIIYKANRVLAFLEKTC